MELQAVKAMPAVEDAQVQVLLAAVAVHCFGRLTPYPPGLSALERGNASQMALVAAAGGPHGRLPEAPPAGCAAARRGGDGWCLSVKVGPYRVSGSPAGRSIALYCDRADNYVLERRASGLRARCRR